MDDRERLAGYIDIWWSAIDDLLRLVEALDAELSPACLLYTSDAADE